MATLLLSTICQHAFKHHRTQLGAAASPVVHRPAHHPHAVVRERGDREAGDQRERVEGGDKHFAEALVPLIVGVLAPQRDDAVHGDGDGHVEDVRAGQRADEELQRLPLLLLGADAEDAPRVGQDGHARADQPRQRVGVDDVILHGDDFIHHVGAGWRGGACLREREHTRAARRRRRRRWWRRRAGGVSGHWGRAASYRSGRALSMGRVLRGKCMAEV